MARGLQKQEAQKKNQAKAATGGKSNLKTRAAGLQVICPKCKTPMSDYNNFKEHFESKHPKDPLPPKETFDSA